MLKKTINDLLVEGIRAYGVNMFCAGKFHGEGLVVPNEQDKLGCEVNKRKYGKTANDILAHIISILENDVAYNYSENSDDEKTIMDQS
jgi:hypothetical protein